MFIQFISDVVHTNRPQQSHGHLVQKRENCDSRQKRQTETRVDAQRVTHTVRDADS